MYSSDDEPKKPKGKSRRELPTGAVATLKAWLLSPEHFTHPYPTPQDQIILMQKTGIDKKQLKNWFTNARRRIWKPMLKKQLEAGKLAATAGGGGGGLSQQGGGLNNRQEQVVSSAPPPPLQQEMYNNYQQATTVTQGSDDYEYGQQQPQYQDNGGYGYDSQQQYQQDTTTQQQQQQPEQFPNCNSIGSLAPLNPNGLSSISSFGRMFKTDSHAVLMELFARDQDLVKQASGQKGGMIQAAAVGNNTSVGSGIGGMTNGISSASMAREINKEMMNNSATNAAGSLLSSAAAAASSSSSTTGNLRSTYNNNNSSSGSPQQQKVTFGNTNAQSSTVPSLSSWPHFSSVSSLNNMGNGGSSLGLKGVKSITNLSAADLSSQGNLNRMGNLAHVKSIENMGRGDSFAFLEVFFDDKSGLGSSSGNIGGGGGGQRGVKREREEDDNAIGLSLDGDDGTTPDTKPPAAAPHPPNPAVPTPAPLPENGVDIAGEGGEVENSENLKRAYDDALAARGLIAVRRSCEKLTDLDLPNKMQRTLSQEYIRQHNQGQPMGDFFSSNNSSFAPNRSPQAAQTAINTSVEVPSSTKCALCSRNLVDTQLRPCGHMFHGRCLKPSLSGGPPQCPICSVPMQSAILAVPATDNNAGVAMGLTLEG